MRIKPKSKIDSFKMDNKLADAFDDIRDTIDNNTFDDESKKCG